MARADGRGRPGFTPLQKAVSTYVKSLEEFNNIDMELAALIGVTEKDEGTERYEDIMEVVDARKCLAEEKDDIISKIRDANKEGNTDLAEKFTARRKSIEADLRDMPQLGFTEAEWESVKEDFEFEQDRGRPSLEIEVRHVRAFKALQESKKMAIEELKKEGKPESTLDTLSKEELNKETKPGRPKNDILGKLDRKAADLIKEIEYIESGEEEKKRAESLNLSDGGTPLGRKHIPIDQLLTNRKASLESVNMQIKDFESKLDEKGILNRSLKHIRDEKRTLKKSLSVEGQTPAEMKNNPKMMDVIAREKAIVDNIKKIDGKSVSRRPAVVAKKDNVQASKVAKAKKQELAKKEAELEASFDDLDSEEQELLNRLEAIKMKRDSRKQA